MLDQKNSRKWKSNNANWEPHTHLSGVDSSHIIAETLAVRVVHWRSERVACSPGKTPLCSDPITLDPKTRPMLVMFMRVIDMASGTNEKWNCVKEENDAGGSCRSGFSDGLIYIQNQQ